MNELEKRIKREFDNMDMSSLPIDSTQASAPKKPKRLRKGSLISLVAIFLVFTGAIAASATGMFGHRQLAEIIGEERAAMATPITFESDYGYTQTEFITNDGLRVGFMAIAAHGNIVNIYVMLEDLVCNRLDGQFFLNYGITLIPRQGLSIEEATEGRGWGMSPLNFTIIDRSETGVVTLYASFQFTVAFDDWDIAFALYNIYFNLENVQDYQILGDLTTLNYEPDTKLGLVTNYIFPFSGVHHMSRGRGLELHEMFTTVGIPTLIPYQTEMAIDLDVPFSISSIGIIDDRLHVQTAGPHRPYRPPGVRYQPARERIEIFLRTPNGGRLFQHGGLSFLLDENGDFYRPYIGWDSRLHRVVGQPYYHEYIFLIDMDRLDEYALYGNFIVLDTIEIGWSTVIDVGMGHGISMSGLDLEFPGVVLHELIITPVSVIVNATKDSLSSTIDMFKIVIHTADGDEIRTTFTSSMSYERGDGTHSLTRQRTINNVLLLDLDTVVAVEVNGVRIELNRFRH